MSETIELVREVDAAYVTPRAKAFARDAGLDVRGQWAVAIAASELATNALKFGPPGALTLRVRRGPPRVLEVEAIDRGPGFVDLDEALRDGVSEGVDRATAEVLPVSRRGLGLGLGAVRRLMHELVVTAREGGGSVVIARLFLDGDQRAAR
ncbi:ATP-binding protein [Sandaracinus amylolyticus]|uniref:ATP-binding protein n=1 Tax=Sandaracinus amylolyticus TaxID=927083 RepID=UPI001F1E783C|nr:ATP-binding protein [Sandaracinus amylolyticus]UJR84562.1 Hypothetical protein I5071_66410 [Sandaracinus amylolyticus]